VTNRGFGITIRNYRRNCFRATNARLSTTLWTRSMRRANEKFRAQFVNGRLLGEYEPILQGNSWFPSRALERSRGRGGRCRVGGPGSCDSYCQINCGSQGGPCDPSTQNHAGGTGSKITALVLGLVEDSVVRSDSRGFGVAESSSKCAVASTVW
jgi:hypothetical protein